MKKVVILILACLLMLSLCACDQGNQSNADNSKPQAGQQDNQTTSSDATDGSHSTQESTRPSQDDLKALAESCIDKPLADLVALIGVPDSSEYAASCAGEGEDGVLLYDGFVVYTYREGEEEKVTYVE